MERKHLLSSNTRLFVLFLILCSCGTLIAQTGNYVFPGAEATNFGTIDLATPTGKTWATARQATPGYFSAVGVATYINPSDANNINGYVKHYATAANQGFSYPVGSGVDYRNLMISGTRAASSVIAVAWILGNPDGNLDPTTPNAGSHAVTSVGTGIQSVSTVGQWDWQDISTNANGLTVTVSIPNLSAFGLAAELRLVGWDGTQWVNLSASTGATGNTEGSMLSGTMINGITAIGVGKSNANLDTDGDGVKDLQEIADGTLPNDPCSYLAANQIYANTTSAFKLLDCDSDGLNNGEEITGVNDPATPANPNGNTSNPFVADTDGDGVTDGQEAINGTLPNDPCSYLEASQIYANTTSTFKLLDCDSDGLNNSEEITGIDNPATSANPNGNTSKPLVADTDGDGKNDSVDACPNISSTNANGCPDCLTNEPQAAIFDNTFVPTGGTTAFFNGVQLIGTAGTERQSPIGQFIFTTNSFWLGASNAAHIDGYATKNGTSAFVFPIGDNGSYRPAAMSGLVSSGSVTAAYFGVNPSTAVTSGYKNSPSAYPVLPSGGPFATSSKEVALGAVSIQEYWDINGASATRITLTYDTNSDIAGLTSNQLADLTIAGWDGTQWVVIPSTLDATPLNGTAFCGTGGLGSSTLASGSITTSAALIPNTYNVYTLAAKLNLLVDTDGDSVTDLQEIADGTLPNDPCSYSAANQIYANTTGAFKLLDCDSDGLNNGEEITGVNDPATPANPNGNTSNPFVADTDGDGVTDGQEAIDGTLPNDPCSYSAANQIYANTTGAFKLLDCDSDGLNNGEEITGVNDPATPANPNGNTSNPLVADTDGDGKNDSVDACPNLPSTNANGCPDCLTSEPQEAIFDNTFVPTGGTTAFFNGVQLIGTAGTERQSPIGQFIFTTNSFWLGASNAAHIDGYATKNGTSAFVFPIGDNGSYRPAAMSGLASLGSVTAAYFGVNPSTAVTSGYKNSPSAYPVLPSGGPFATSSKEVALGSVSTQEYWDINGASATRITLTYDTNSDIAGLTSNQLADLTIAGWDGTQWVVIPSTLDATPLNGTAFCGTGGLGSSTLASGSITTTAALIPNTYNVYTLAAKACQVIASPTAVAATPIKVCSGASSTLSATCATGTVTWHTDLALTTVSTNTVNPTNTTTYYVACVQGVCKSPSVSVVVLVSPCANPDVVTAVVGTTTTIPILTNDKNPDGTPVTDLTKITLPTLPITGVDAPAKGTATVNPDGTISYTANPGTSGTDTFVYTICDKLNPTVCDTAKVTVAILIDTDKDGVADIDDLDDDNDGILDTEEDSANCSEAGGAALAGDCDGDGIPNSLDLDSDNDGINDVIEAGGTDLNGDGQADGTPGTTPTTSGIPATAGTGLTPPNTDGTGGSDPYDIDSNGDNVFDFSEFGLNPLFDANNDGIVDGNLDPDNDGILSPVDGQPSVWGDALLPDLTPTTEINSLEFLNGGDEKDFVVNIFEINSIPNVNGSTIIFRLNKLSAFDITYQTASGTSNVFGGISNSNSDWVFTENSSFITITAKPGVVISPNGSKQIGFKAKRKVGVPINTSQNITVTIIFGSAGEELINNNLVETKITAN